MSSGMMSKKLPTPLGDPETLTAEGNGLSEPGAGVDPTMILVGLNPPTESRTSTTNGCAGRAIAVSVVLGPERSRTPGPS